MNLYFLRHGIASNPDPSKYPSDADRPLTDEGVEQVGKVGQGIKSLGISFDAILSSPYLRTQQTSEKISKATAFQGSIRFTNNLACGFNLCDLITEISAEYPDSENVLLIGHEPDLSQSIAFLVSDHSGRNVRMDKASLAKLSTPELRNGPCASLQFLRTAHELAALA